MRFNFNNSIFVFKTSQLYAIIYYQGGDSVATLKSKTLFFTTSPRTPAKMIPEIKLLAENFTGKAWNKQNQISFIEILSGNPNFEGQGSQGNLAFSARDRINRAPKALGFVDLNPTIQLTDAGQSLVSEKRIEETLLRQLMKFQLPSPYHKEPTIADSVFWVKPYLEMLRLIYTLGKISFDEIMIFGMQLTDYRLFDKIVKSIQEFRTNRTSFLGSYKQYLGETLNSELLHIFETEIQTGNTSTRQSTDASLTKFKKTKRSNLRDYTDACFRYLRATGLVSISHIGRSLSVMPDKVTEVEFLLNTVDRKPVFVDDEAKYKEYLFNASTPALYTDNKKHLEEYILRHSSTTKKQVEDKSIEVLKDLRDDIIQKNRESIISTQVKALKSYSLYSEVVDTYNEIISDELYDIPLMLEWNTWRAMTMLNGGQITGNFKVDDAGQPMSTAIGNTPDIVCDYGDFGITVEVTMQSGQRQYESEGEPVARHLAKFKKAIGKEAFCLFIAPKINEASIAHFYALSKTNISYYGGTSVILPLELDVFMKMVENSYGARFVPTPQHIKELFDFSKQAAETATNEMQWYTSVQDKAMQWLVA